MFEFCPPRVRLQTPIAVPRQLAQRLRFDFERFRAALPVPLESYVLNTYGLDLRSVYGGTPVKNPFGKASGQLSLSVSQVARDAAGGLGFVVLKTLIAQDATGAQSMREWAIPETHMTVEPTTGRDGAQGWTVTWKGRGWFGSFQDYLQLLADSVGAARTAGMLIVPSVKYHLPDPSEHEWRKEEYTFTTSALLEIWSRHLPQMRMPLEKDFSPTLAGSSRSRQQAQIIEWLERVPGLIWNVAPKQLSVGIKVFNSVFDDSFQLEMLQVLHQSPEPADFLIYANRLFDAGREYEGRRGVAYGGPDLSERNLTLLERYLDRGQRLMPFSATGNIHNGWTAAEYLLRGASTFQMHTLFQLPASEYPMTSGDKTDRAIHRLLFDPEAGFIAALLDLRERFGWPERMNVAQAAEWCSANWPTIRKDLQGD